MILKFTDGVLNTTNGLPKTRTITHFRIMEDQTRALRKYPEEIVWSFKRAITHFRTIGVGPSLIISSRTESVSL
jgi:hypothetical protein